MFKRENRLPRGIGFRGMSFFPTPFFVLKVRKNELALNRFGVVVSKKIDKRASFRNRIKRMVRKIFIDLNKEMAGYDILLIARLGIVSTTDDRISFAIRETLKKGGCIKQ
ncbi:MAG: ribonuclease P protein component [Patescibacteria group bacterium]